MNEHSLLQWFSSAIRLLLPSWYTFLLFWDSAHVLGASATDRPGAPTCLFLGVQRVAPQHGGMAPSAVHSWASGQVGTLAQYSLAHTPNSFCSSVSFLPLCFVRGWMEKNRCFCCALHPPPFLSRMTETASWRVLPAC